ncbi:MAG: RnfABCDGE type electron transport complex subunit B, partial [Clostridia bacterium]|nr:RnfABCDGE type electron transport complex subunit B [Clostridia bacterium]
FFYVAEDPKKQEIRACLPGINCGACGYKGCDDYAEALAGGGVKPSLCLPGAQDTANMIAEILGVEPEEQKETMAFVACNGKCDATFKKAEYNGIESCAAASIVYGGDNSCSFGCLGFGDCAAVCPSEAICLADGIARVEASRCISCGLCVETCPKHIISLIPKQTQPVVMCSNTQKGVNAKKACKNACIGCKKCEKTCPTGAITVKNNLARVDYSKCSSCGACALECPTGCLKNVFFS